MTFFFNRKHYRLLLTQCYGNIFLSGQVYGYLRKTCILTFEKHYCALKERTTTSVMIQVITNRRKKQKINFLRKYFLKGILFLMHGRKIICTLEYIFPTNSLLTQHVIHHQKLSCCHIFAVEVIACCLLKSMLLLSVQAGVIDIIKEYLRKYSLKCI